MKKLAIILFIVIIILIGIFFGVASKKTTPQPKKATEKVVLSLDWTPNTNHTGIYVAQNKNYFKDEGLTVAILPYSSNASPDVLVVSGKADIGISSTEWIVADAALGSPVVSIAAIIQHNTSALITRTDSNLKRPKDLSGKIYGGFGAPFESAVVSQIIKQDGGNPIVKNIILDVDALQALESKRIDFIWGYEGWEVIQAKREGYTINVFPITQYGIPNYYSPVFITSQKTIDQKADILKKFMKALSRGYEFARENPKKAAEILIQAVPKGTFPDEQFVYESQDFLSARYADEGRKWGLQDKSAWHDYPQFILDSGSIKDANGIVVKNLDLDTLYTNTLLPE